MSFEFKNQSLLEQMFSLYLGEKCQAVDDSLCSRAKLFGKVGWTSHGWTTETKKVKQLQRDRKINANQSK